MIIGIVSEYNPFHNGHLYQISEIRKEFGDDTVIIAVMSGNYTQRGDISIADKVTRAKCAVLCGVDLVLELPYPFSSSNAEIFASAAIKILSCLGCVDYISFGSESADLAGLEKIAEILSSDKFQNDLDEQKQLNENQSTGYPALIEMCLKKSGYNIDSFAFTPNNILAIEYIKAIKKLKCNIKPHTIKRIANSYDSEEIVDGSIQSATSIRNIMNKDIVESLKYLPEETRNIVYSEFNSGYCPCDIENISKAILAYFRVNSQTGESSIPLDAKGGLYNRIKKASFNSASISELVSHSESKKYTTARIRRAIMNSFLGATSSQIEELPYYTQVLAMNKSGRIVLRRILNSDNFYVLTKPSDIDKLPEKAKKQAICAIRADRVYDLARPSSKDPNFFLKFTPYVEK